MTILIPEMMRRNVLAAIRSLGRQGHRITLAAAARAGSATPSTFSRTIARLARSRYVSDVRTIRSVYEDIDAYVEDIVQLVKTGQYDVVIPFDHVECGAVSYGKERIEQYAGVVASDLDHFMTFHNKLTAIRLAESLGVPVPETHCPQSGEELEELAATIAYPVVVKARIGCGVRRGIRYARDREELLTKYAEVTASPSYEFLDDFSRPLIQEYIPGQIHDVATMCSHGTLRGALTQLRAITYPLTGGVGAVNVTTREPEMLEMARRLLETAGWHGPALVEFKLDSRDNTYKLLEVNPKFWGTTDLSIKAGIDFPQMACEIARDGDTKPRFDYRVGLTYRWATGYEILCVTQAPDRLKALREYIGRFFRGNTVYDFSPTDPMPDIMGMLVGVMNKVSGKSLWTIGEGPGAASFNA